MLMGELPLDTPWQVTLVFLNFSTTGTVLFALQRLGGFKDNKREKDERGEKRRKKPRVA